METSEFEDAKVLRALEALLDFIDSLLMCKMQEVGKMDERGVNPTSEISEIWEIQLPLFSFKITQKHFQDPSDKVLRNLA